MIKEFISKSIKDTIEFAEKFADSLCAGDIVLLRGDLGAGKTLFVKAITDKLSGGKSTAVSPTFTIVNSYDTVPRIHHFDLYRINSVGELDAIGAEEYFYSDGICFVEWPERAEGYFLTDTINVEILKINESERLIRVER